MSSPYDTVDLHDLELPPKHKRRTGLVAYIPCWLLLGLIISALVHVGLVYLFQAVPLNAIDEAFSAEEPPQFKVTRVEIDPALLEEEPLEPAEEPLRPEPISDIKAFEEMMEQEPVETTLRDLRVAPQASPVPEDFLEQLEQPVMKDVTAQDIEKLRQVAGEPGESALNDMEDRIAQELMDTQQARANQPKIQVSTLAEDLRKKAGTGADYTVGGRAYSDIDKLLQQSGAIPSGSALPPLMMPSDVLFATNSADLRPEAVSSLQKLGQLLHKHPEVSYRVEGHTDSFGSEPFNDDLSRRRAESVKNWLIQNMRISPDRVATLGLGESRLLVPQGNEQEQQMNRRVEIFITTPGR